MDPRKRKSNPGFSGDLAEVQQQIEMWSSKAAELRPNVMALGFALSAHASQIAFNGDMIVVNAPAGRDSEVGILSLDLATIRRIVCNLKMLEAQREQLQVSEERANYNRDSVLIL